jgi:hypothetical protein
MKKYSVALCSTLFLLLGMFQIVKADDAPAVNPYGAYNPYHFYAGFGLGYGDTNWDQLVNTSSWLVEISAPNGATSGGMTQEVFGGYMITPYFALEARVAHYPEATVHFKAIPDEPNPYGVSNFTTNTNDYSVVGKFYVPISVRHQISAFADSGLSYTQRYDVLTNSGAYQPTFGGGFQWRFAQHWDTNFEFEYVPGVGKTSELPVTDYIPFLYNIEFRVAYLF